MVGPLFIKDRSLLLKKLRLNQDADETLQQVVDDCILDARIGFYEKLGSSTVAAIAAITRSDSPSTTNEIRRARAESAEFSWVRMLLLRRTSNYVEGASARAMDDWNASDLNRMDENEREGEIKRLEQEIADHLDFLNGNSAPRRPNVTVIGPDETNTYPGSEIGI